MDNMNQPTHLTPAQLAARLQVTERLLESWRYRKKGPPFVRIGRTVRYPADQIETWMKENLT